MANLDKITLICANILKLFCGGVHFILRILGKNNQKFHEIHSGIVGECSIENIRGPITFFIGRFETAKSIVCRRRNHGTT